MVRKSLFLASFGRVGAGFSNEDDSTDSFLDAEGNWGKVWIQPWS